MPDRSTKCGTIRANGRICLVSFYLFILHVSIVKFWYRSINTFIHLYFRIPGWSHASTSNSNSQREIVTNDQQGQQFPPYGRTPTSHPYGKYCSFLFSSVNKVCDFTITATFSIIGNTSPYPVFGQPSQRQTGTNYQQLPAHDISGNKSLSCSFQSLLP